MLIVEYLGAGIAVITFIGGIFAWYSASVRKEYASQRDWEHVKNNQKQLIENINFLFKEQDEKLETIRHEHDQRFDKIDGQNIRLEAMFYALFADRINKIKNTDRQQ